MFLFNAFMGILWFGETKIHAGHSRKAMVPGLGSGIVSNQPLQAQLLKNSQPV